MPEQKNGLFAGLGEPKTVSKAIRRKFAIAVNRNL